MTAAAAVKVAGYCPMGCGSTLMLDDAGHLLCTWVSCPRPEAADLVLADREAEHQVELRADGFTVKHPLRERLDDQLVTCPLASWVEQQGGPPMPPGRYRVRQLADPELGSFWSAGWSWEALS